MRAVALAALFAVLFVIGERYADAGEPMKTRGDRMLGLPSLEDRAASSAVQISLGRKLFLDVRLSRNGSVGCVTCHDPKLAFTDGRPVSIGIGQSSGTRNAPSLVNVAYVATLLWDGRRSTLEEQVAGPFTNPREHGLATHGELVAAVLALDDYRANLAMAFGNAREGLQPSQLFGALASYLRTLRVGDSAFDRYYFGGDQSALTEAERRGFELFRGPARCTQCHTIEKDGALFTDHKFHSVGVGGRELAMNVASLTKKVVMHPMAHLDELITADRDVAALGRFLVTRDPKDIGKYRTPSLRNVALTAPYMHDGSVATLREAVELELYYRSVESGRPIALTPTEREDLAAFLGALTSSCLAQAKCSFF